MIRRNLTALAQTLFRQKRLTRCFFFSSKDKTVQKKEEDEEFLKNRDIKAMPNLRFLIDKVKEQNSKKGMCPFEQIRSFHRRHLKTRGS